MKGKLPGVYINKFNKKIKNNDKIYYSATPLREETFFAPNNIVDDDLDIDIYAKIKDMFNSPNYVYKMGVLIYTKDGKKIEKEIIGKIDDKLITLDEEYIPISNIKNIKY